MYEGESVVTRWQALDFVFSIGPGNGVERALYHVDVHFHPWVLVALYRQHNFFTGESLLEGSCAWWLRLVPLAIVFRSGMNIVGGGVVVLDFDILSRHYGEHVRMITAALLVEYDSVLGDVKAAVAEAALHVNEHVSQIAIFHDHCLGGIVALAGRILTHINLRRLGGRTVEFHGAAYGSGGAGIDRRRGGGGFGFRGGRGRLLFACVLLAAPGQEQQAEECEHPEHC